MFAGHFNRANLNGVMVLETGVQISHHRLEVAAKLNMRVSPMGDRVHLVNNFGELMLVHRQGGCTSRNKPRWWYITYRLDLDTGTIFPVKNLGGVGRELFMGRYCSLSVRFSPLAPLVPTPST
jgi:hypothetical protein